MSDSIVKAIEQIRRRDSTFAASCHQYRFDVRQRQACGVLMPSDIAGKRVLDWECGGGAFSAVLLEHGAAHVTGIDSSSQNVFEVLVSHLLVRSRGQLS